MLSFPLFMLVLAVLVFETVQVIRSKVHSFSTLSHALARCPPSSSPQMICSCGSAILAGSHINADVTGFLQFQLEGINRNCKRIPLPHLAVFLD